MENKQTAVEWFAQRIQSDKIFSFDVVLKKAFTIEREQIETAYKSDRRPCSDEDAQEYYNDTYGK